MVYRFLHEAHWFTGGSNLQVAVEVFFLPTRTVDLSSSSTTAELRDRGVSTKSEGQEKRLQWPRSLLVTLETVGMVSLWPLCCRVREIRPKTRLSTSAVVRHELRATLSKWDQFTFPVTWRQVTELLTLHYITLHYNCPVTGEISHLLPTQAPPGLGAHREETGRRSHGPWCGSPECSCLCRLACSRGTDTVSSCFLKQTDFIKRRGQNCLVIMRRERKWRQ